PLPHVAGRLSRAAGVRRRDRGPYPRRDEGRVRDERGLPEADRPPRPPDRRLIGPDPPPEGGQPCARLPGPRGLWDGGPDPGRPGARFQERGSRPALDRAPRVLKPARRREP